MINSILDKYMESKLFKISNKIFTSKNSIIFLIVYVLSVFTFAYIEKHITKNTPTSTVNLIDKNIIKRV